MAEQEQDRSEAATPFKLSEAKRKGSVAKSPELSSLFALLTLMVVIALWARPGLERQFRMDAAIFELGARLSFEPSVMMRWLSLVMTEALAQMVPLMLPIVAVAILGGLLQSGPIFSLHAIKPDIDRINPVSGFKRLFSMRLVFETVKNVVKLLLFGAALYMLFVRMVPELIGLMQMAPVQQLEVTLSHALVLIAKLTVIVALIAVIDMAYSRWSWLDKLKMSRREVRDELKNREGDPRIRARLRELRRETLKRSQAMRRLPEADVLITNPTHLAVALLYQRERMAAPQLIAKGSGEAAAQMRVLARRHGVPIVSNPTLARALFAGAEIDAPVPEGLFPQVARLLVWVYALRDGSAARGASTAGHAAHARAAP